MKKLEQALKKEINYYKGPGIFYTSSSTDSIVAPNFHSYVEDFRHNAEGKMKYFDEMLKLINKDKVEEAKGNKEIVETRSLYLIGLIYAVGYGEVKLNPKKAKDWLKDAANRGHKEAQKALNDCF